jgi:hypothetical protein
MKLRPESSVSLDTNEYGELCFAGDGNGPVVHRTPQELGIPTVIADDAPGKLMPWIDRERIVRVRRVRDLPESDAAREQREELERLARELKDCVIGGEPVRMSAAATMGSEMLGKPKEERGMNDFNLSDGVNARIVEEITLPAAELANKHGVPVSRIYGLRSQLKRNGKLPAKAERSERKVKDAVRKKPKPKALARLIDVDPGRSSMADSLINALGARDVAQMVIGIAMTPAEVAKVIGKLSAPQKEAFLNAGMRAALLA